MAHYHLHNSQDKLTEEFEKLTEDELNMAINHLHMILELIVDGELKAATVEGAVADEHLTSNDPVPTDITLRDPSGLSVKIMNDTLYVGTNGDWLNFSVVYDFLEIDWKTYFEG